MNWIVKILFGVSTLFLMIVIILILVGKLTFGYGLGDIFYLIILVFVTLVISITFFLTMKFDFNKNKILSGFIAILLILVIYIYARLLTVDRGAEYKWDGHIFLSYSSKRNELKLTYHIMDVVPFVYFPFEGIFLKQQRKENARAIKQNKKG